MKARHEHWANLWNAEIDALKPRTIGALRRDMALWEASRNRKVDKPTIDRMEDASKYVVSDPDRPRTVKVLTFWA